LLLYHTTNEFLSKNHFKNDQPSFIGFCIL
jgi:hypothetical protein